MRLRINTCSPIEEYSRYLFVVLLSSNVEWGSTVAVLYVRIRIDSCAIGRSGAKRLPGKLCHLGATAASRGRLDPSARPSQR